MWTTTAFNNKPVELYCGQLLKNKFNLISKVISKTDIHGLKYLFIVSTITILHSVKIFSSIKYLNRSEKYLLKYPRNSQSFLVYLYMLQKPNNHDYNIVDYKPTQLLQNCMILLHTNLKFEAYTILLFILYSRLGYTYTCTILSTIISRVYGFKSEIQRFEIPGAYDFFREKSFVRTHLFI